MPKIASTTRSAGREQRARARARPARRARARRPSRAARGSPSPRGSATPRARGRARRARRRGPARPARARSRSRRRRCSRRRRRRAADARPDSAARSPRRPRVRRSPSACGSGMPSRSIASRSIARISAPVGHGQTRGHAVRRSRGARLDHDAREREVGVVREREEELERLDRCTPPRITSRGSPLRRRATSSPASGSVRPSAPRSAARPAHFAAKRAARFCQPDFLRRA